MPETTPVPALERAILDLLADRAGSICPSEAARLVAGDDDDSAWRALMEPAREAARRLVAARRVVVTQGGVAVDAASARGPIRIERGPAFPRL